MAVYVTGVDRRSSHDQYQVAIYADAGGAPGALIAHSATGTLHANAWNTISIAATLQANTAYWLMYSTNGTSGSVNDMNYSSGGSSAWSSSQPFGAWPTSFGAVAGTSGASFSIYATFSGTAAAAPHTGTLTRSAPAVAIARAVAGGLGTIEHRRSPVAI